FIRDCQVPKLRLRKFDNVRVTLGKLPTRAELLDKINAHDLRTHEHRFGVGSRNDQTRLREQADRVKAVPGVPGCRFIGLYERLDRATRQMNADYHSRGISARRRACI